MPTLDEPINIIDPATVSPRPTGMKWGFIWGVVAIILALVGYLTGLTDPANATGTASILFGIIAILVAIVAIVKAIQEHRTQLGGYIRGGRAVAVGMWSGLGYGIIYGLWTLIFVNFIAPDFIADTIASQRIQMEAQGQSDEQIDAALGIMEMFNGPVTTFFSSLIGGLIIGVIIAVIAAFFLKKKAPGQF